MVHQAPSTHCKITKAMNSNTHRFTVGFTEMIILFGLLKLNYYRKAKVQALGCDLRRLYARLMPNEPKKALFFHVNMQLPGKGTKGLTLVPVLSFWVENIFNILSKKLC